MKSSYRGMESKIWVTENGEILREESPLGWTLVREPQVKATKLLKEVALYQEDIIKQVSIPSNLFISSPEQISFLKVKLYLPSEYKQELSDYRQKVLDRDANGEVILEINKKIPSQNKILKLPLSSTLHEDLLKSSLFIQANDVKIKRLVQKIVGQEIDSYKASKNIMSWVYKNMLKTPTVSMPSAIDVLNKASGDCNELTYLFASLARAYGIPSEVIVGVVYREGRFYYHAWPRVFVGEWLDMDPTYGQEVADATHIKFAEGELSEQLKLVSLINKLKIEILEYK
jgi:transglutaminase-like putative cysteine protease